MSKIEVEKQYLGRDLETIFFRPIMTGPDARELGIRMMYNMPVPTTLHFWGRTDNVLQEYDVRGWRGSDAAMKYQKTIQMTRIKAEMGYSAEDYFARVYELISARADVNMDDLSGTELEEAETTLFRAAIAESLRMTMWIGYTGAGRYNTFDGFISRFLNDLQRGEESLQYQIYTPLGEPSDAEALLKTTWDNAPQALKAAKSQGNLAYFVTSDVYAKYEESLENAQCEAAYLAKQNGIDSLTYRGIPVIDLQLGGYAFDEMPPSLAILSDRRNLALAVNTSDFPGTEVRMWYNPDEMQNRQRAIFTVGCDYLLPEMVSISLVGAKTTIDRSSVTATGGAVRVTCNQNGFIVGQVDVVGLKANGEPAGSSRALSSEDDIFFTGSISGSNIANVLVTISYTNGLKQQIIK